MITAYRHGDRRQGRELMTSLIASLSSGVPKPLIELTTLGRTLKKRADDVLAGPAHRTARRRRSTAGSSTSAAPRSGSATSPTTSPDPCSRPAGSDRDYTLDWDEPPLIAIPAPRWRLWCKDLSVSPQAKGKPIRPPRPWKPRDFITHRTFCPVDEIQEALDVQRELSDATELLLIALDDSSVLRTLTLLSAEGGDAHPLARALRETDADMPFRRRTSPLWQPFEEGPASKLVQVVVDNSGTVPGLTGTFPSALSELHRSSPWILAQPTSPDAELAVNCLLLYRGAKDHSFAADFSDRVTASINATVNASVHRDARVAATIRRSLRSGLSSKASSVRSLLELACEVTASDAAVVFELDIASARTPRLIGGEIVSTAGHKLRLAERVVPAAIPKPSEGDGSRSYLATAAHFRGRPQLIQSGALVDELDPSFVVGERRVSVEIAMPMPSGLGSGMSPAVGVLVLARTAEHAKPYAEYDMALLRNITLRLALLRATLQLGDASAGVVATTAPVAFAEPVERDAPTMSDQLVIESLPAEFSGSGLPLDLRRAAELTVPIVQFAARVTTSHSATLRLLASEVDPNTDEVRYMLRRVVAWPAWRHVDEDEPDAIDPSSARSANAWVARTGRELHIPDLRRADALRDYDGLESVLVLPRRESRTELCVPVFVDGRVVGTINLESPHAMAYEMLIPVVRAASAQISLAIAGIRREFLREVLSIGSDVQNSAHDLNKLLRELDNHDGPPSSAVTRIRETLDVAINLLRPTQVPDAATGEPPTMGLSNVLQSASEAAGVAIGLVDTVDVQVLWTRRTHRRIYLALFEVIRNMGAYRWLGPEGLPRATIRRALIGGRAYAEVVFIHRYRPGAEPDPITLYRAPVEQADGLHFGAYTAGAIVRSLGGDIHAVRLDDSTELVVIVSLPIEERS